MIYLLVYIDINLTILRYWNKMFSLKLVSTFFIFSPDDESPSKTMICFLFQLKSSFLSQDIQIFSLIIILINFCPFHVFKIKNNKWKWKIYDLINWLALINRCNFWSNSKTALNCVIKLGQVTLYTTNEGIFLNLLLVPGNFSVFHNLVH